MNLLARAKINLMLEVLGKRQDGYHELMMIMQSVDIYDKIELEYDDEPSIRLECNWTEIADSQNLAYRAAQLFFKEIKTEGGCIIRIEKHIPMQAGLAGGSTDAAAVLLGLNELLDARLSTERLQQMANQLGSDVAFCLFGGTKLAQGRGEQLTALENLDLSLLIIKPSENISTKAVFDLLEPQDYSDGSSTRSFIQALKKQDRNQVFGRMVNHLYPKSLRFAPTMQSIITQLENDFGCQKAMMSGSGSTVFGIFDSASAREAAYEYFAKRYEKVFKTRTHPHSITMTR